jgi:choline dehydrogenase-like flavoprotein
MLKLMRRLMAQKPLADFVAEETTPGAGVQSNQEVGGAFAGLGQAGYHACGTCRMGADHDEVLDSRMRVRGVENLRVVDLSMFPPMISGNTNGPIMALAGRAADLILEDDR